MKILTIDPSVNNVGFAYFDTETRKLRTRTFHPPKADTQFKSQRMPRIANQILHFIAIEFLPGQEVDCVTIEYPAWENSQRGAIAAQKGYTIDLAFLAGFLSGIYSLSWRCIWTPTPQDWKGNMPKSATVHRVQKEFGMLQISEHEYDAVGLVLWTLKQPGIK